MIDKSKITNEVRELVLQYMGGYIKEAEMLEFFDLKRCDNCEIVEFEEELTDTEGMIGGGIGLVCPGCLEDME